MKSLLSKSQRDAINQQFANLYIYRAIKQPCWELITPYMPHLKLRAEDVLYYYFRTIDGIRDKQDSNIELEINNLWESIYDDIDHISTAPQSEKDFAVAEIIMVVLLSMQTINHIPLLNSLSLRLNQLLISNAEQHWDLLCHTFLLHFQTWGIDHIAHELTEYLSSDACYSEDIELIGSNTGVDTTANEKNSTLTTSQIAILLIESLNLHVEQINATALGNLINAITGKSRGRVTVEDIRRNGYNARDAQIIADYLANIKPELAQHIKNGSIE